mmetsp:Transcript_23289/g.26971  ORF Transcript_23289/g.26971 Transcript_23289/m.26971 type:complete len:929 (+) Transcript_23289:239-3025(+)
MNSIIPLEKNGDETCQSLEINGMKVIKLKKDRIVNAPFGTKLGLNIEAVPPLGIGVTTVNKNSVLFDKIHRGEIFSYFMGKSLHKTSAKEFSRMLGSADGNDGKRELVITYAAEDFKASWKNPEKAVNSESMDIESEDNEKSNSEEKSKRVTLSSDNYQEWLVQKKTAWNFEERVKKTNDSTDSSPDFESAASFNFPEGWTVRRKPKSRFTFCSPDGELFYSKKAAFESIGLSSPNDSADDQLGLVEDCQVRNGLDKTKIISERYLHESKPVEQDKSLHFTMQFDGVPQQVTKDKNKDTDANDNGVTHKTLSGHVGDSESVSPDVFENSKNHQQNTSSQNILKESKTNLEAKKQDDVSGKPMLRPIEKSSICEASDTKRIPETSIEKSSVCEASDTTRILEASSTSKILTPTKQSLASEKAAHKVDISLHANPNRLVSISVQDKSSNYAASQKPFKGMTAEQFAAGGKSLSDIISMLTHAREIVNQFGPLPWDGCRIYDVLPAPLSLGVHIQCQPSKFGIGVVNVERSSPFKNKLKRGDIITHFMGMPLYGLKAQDFARLVKSETRIQRTFHVAPENFYLPYDVMANGEIRFRTQAAKETSAIVEPSLSSSSDIGTILQPNTVTQKVTIIKIPPFKGSLGLNIQALAKNCGIGIVQVNESSPVRRKLQRGDLIISLMGKSLQGVSVPDFIKMLKQKGKGKETLIFGVVKQYFEGTDSFKSNGEAAKSPVIRRRKREIEPYLPTKITELGRPHVVIAPPGVLGLNYKETKSSIGFVVVKVPNTSKFFEIINPSDVITHIDWRPLHGMKTEELETILRSLKNSEKKLTVRPYIKNQANNEYYAESSAENDYTDTPLPSLQQDNIVRKSRDKSTFNNIKCLDVASFQQEDVAKMPVCFAFDPDHLDSKKTAERKEASWHGKLHANKRQKAG